MNSGIWIAAGATFVAVMGTAWAVRRDAERRREAERVRLWSEERRPKGPLDSYRRNLDDAGLKPGTDRVSFVLLHALCVLSGGLGGVLLAQRSVAELAPSVLLALLGGLLGWWLPQMWLDGRRTLRRLALAAEFPGMLDLLQISMQGGMSLAAAWKSVSNSLDGRGAALADEMRRVDLEVGFATSWTRALDSATARTGVDEFRALGLLLEQTERFGTEMARAIAVLSESLRHAEVQALEERAHEASVKMLFPLALFLLPATLMLIIGPLLTMLFAKLADATGD
ncbi:MAG: type II secretion system F family protein [Planctomycetes bacterium]|nr:type II secretion system F family protein [Planctomycetota bacterium]